MDHVLTGLDFFERFGFAVLLGTLIGLEREWRQRSAGVHTLALVCGGTSLFVMITPLIVAPSASENMSRTICRTDLSCWPGSRILMNQAFSAKRQASR